MYRIYFICKELGQWLQLPINGVFECSSYALALESYDEMIRHYPSSIFRLVVVTPQEKTLEQNYKREV